MIESYLPTWLKEKDILPVTHIILGYPSFEDYFSIIETMVKAGVDLMELQVPFSEELAAYLIRCRKAVHLPLAFGFGVKETKNIDFLKGKADIAVIGTQTIRIIEKEGIISVGDFVRSLR